MVRIVLNCEIHCPNVDDKMTDIIDNELSKDLKIISNNLSDKVAELINKYSKLRIHSEAS